MATEYTGEIIPVGGKEYTGEVVSSPKEKSSAYDDFMKIPRALYGPVEAATTVGTGLASGLAGTLYGAAKHYGEQPGSGAGRGPLAAEKEAQEFQQKYTYEPRTESGKQIVGGIAKGAQALERTGIPQAMMPLAGLTGELSAVGQLAKPAAQYARAATQPLTEGLKTAVTSPLTKAAEIAVGKTTPSTEKSIRQREKQGYVLEPGQLKEQEPLGSPGFSAIGTSKIQRKNQTLANQDASKETGNIASYGQLDGEHLKNTKKALGEEYGKIFGTKENPKEIQIDEKLVNLAQQAKDFEQSVGPAGAGTIGKTADNIIKRFDEIQLLQKKIAPYQKKPVTRLAPPTPMAASTKKNWTNLVEAKDKTAPAFASDIQKTIDELATNLNLAVKPKVWFGTDRGGSTYGMASSDGHIIIRSGMDKEGSLATALHEFGHQGEFQLLKHAPSNVQADIYKAFQEHRKSTPLGKTTVEQYRPLTASKYPEQYRASIPSRTYEQEYLRNFSEWFAEQTSRWITTSKVPTTTVEKFFAGVGKMWKDIYQKVTGHVGLSKEVEEFYRSNWKGNLTQQAVQEEPILQATPQFAGGVDGRELQALRSNLSDFAYKTEGLEKRRAYDLLRAIDDAIEQSNNQLAPKLKEVNRRYAANEALLDLYQKGGIKQGNISLERLWNVTKNFGESHPLYDLGKFGHDARLRAIWEGREKPPTELGRYLSMGKRATLGLALDSPLGRALQRKISEPQP
jgi:hypothetical protein